MILRSLILPVLLLLSGAVYAQKINVAYYNVVGDEVMTKEQASFFSEFHVTDTGIVHNRFFIATNKIAIVEHFKDTAALIKEGKWISFYYNEQKKSVGGYKENKKDGLWLSFYPNGYLKDSVWFEMGQPVGIAVSWHSNGMMSDSVNYGADKSFKITWFDNGQPGSFGAFRKKEDSLLGKWSFYHKNGQIAAQETYDDKGALITGKYFDEYGKAITDIDEISREQQEAQLFDNFKNYLDPEITFPVKNPKSDFIISLAAEITIDENGTPEDIFILVPSSEANNMAFVKALKSFGKWPSFSDKNRKIKYTIVLPRIYYYNFITAPKRISKELDTNNGLYKSRFDPKIESDRRFRSSMRGQGVNDKW